MSLGDIFVSWFPMLLVIVVWLIFMAAYGKKAQKKTAILEEQKELLERMVVANENIARSLEKIAHKQ